MRELDAALELGGERLALGRALGQRAGLQPRDRVDEHHRRQLAAGEDVRPDRDRVRAEVREDPLVEALEPRGEEGQPLLAGELLDDRLVELAALRRERDHAVLGHAAVDGVERRRGDVHAQHHARPAAVRRVVHLAVRKRRRVAVAEEAQVDLGAEHGRERTLLGQPTEGVRNKGEDVDLHSGSVRETGGDVDCACAQVDLADALLVHGQEDPGVELEDVVRDARRDLLHRAEPAAALLDDLEADELEDVEAVVLGLGQR